MSGEFTLLRVFKEFDLKVFLFILSLVFGVVGFLCVVMWMVFYTEKYFAFAFERPNRARLSSFRFQASYSDWQVMYYVTRIMLLSAAYLVFLWIFG